MVYEFPELQGLMGRYYIEASGEDAAVAAAAQEHYAPLGPSDDVPTAPVSVAVSLAEKIDKLTGFWAIDEKPTGSKDPFALRRAALGVIRLTLDNDLGIQLRTFLLQHTSKIVGHVTGAQTYQSYKAIEDALKGKPGSEKLGSIETEIKKTMLIDPETDEGRDRVYQIFDQAINLLSFIHDRLKVYLKDQGIRHDIIDACIAMDGNDDINLLVKRARALSETLKTEDGKNLIQGFKRANNILSQAEAVDGVEYSYGADVKFAETDEERALFAALDTNEPTITKAMAEQDFTTAMSAMASLRAPIDAFFDATQINADNDTVRRNRLNLLSRIRTICSSVADLTKIDG
jgi:glycyl-tRNA synthetase beta chain